MSQPETVSRKRIFSGVQPTGTLTLGNYLGAMRNWAPLQEEYDCIYCVVDQHAITVRQEPAQLRAKTLEVFAMLIAVGLRPEQSVLYVQSHVPAHSQMAWALGCMTGMGELSRMTQFKDKSAKQEQIYSGLFTYPTLMAADILLYNADGVPVGEDQKQHVELTRDLAMRFNSAYSPTFTVPEPITPKIGARIKSLAEPTRKMSKSDEPHTYIALTDAPDVIRQKFRRAVTDSETDIRFDVENKPGVSNLLTIYAAMRGVTVAEAEADFAGQGYGTLKDGVAEAVVSGLAPVQQSLNDLLADKDRLYALMQEGAARANDMAMRTLSKVYRKLGFVLPQR